MITRLGDIRMVRYRSSNDASRMEFQVFKQKLPFPMWILVNSEQRSDDGCPYYLLQAGSHPPHAPFPQTLYAYSSEERAKKDCENPFRPEVIKSADDLCHTLSEYPDIEQIVVDKGTPSACLFRSSEIIAEFSG
jgi:hypothetical protein